MAADFIEEIFATGLPLFEVWGVHFIGSAGKDEVGHFEIISGSVLAVGLGVDLFSDAERGFADFFHGADVADDGGVNFLSINDQAIIADRWFEGPRGIFCGG